MNGQKGMLYIPSERLFSLGIKKQDAAKILTSQADLVLNPNLAIGLRTRVIYKTRIIMHTSQC